MRKVKLDVWIEPDQWAALEEIAERSDSTVRNTLEGMITTALDDLSLGRSGKKVAAVISIECGR